jgi:hypothetical protein
MIDGAAQAAASGDWRAPLTGRHHVVVSAPGRRTVTMDVDVDSGALVQVPVVLPRVRGKAPPRRATVARSARDDFHSVDPWRR